MDDEDFQAVKVHFHIISSLVQRTCTIQLYMTVSHGGLGRPCTLVVSDTCTMYTGASISFEIDACRLINVSSGHSCLLQGFN